MELVGVIKNYPELVFISSGKAICSFYVDGTKCIAWEELGEKINQNILPGDKVKVFGYVKERWWTTSEGEKRRAEELTVNRIQVLERPKPIEGCCYSCLHRGVCLKQCYSAMGGIPYMDACRVENGKCMDIDNSECWKLLGKES